MLQVSIMIEGQMGLNWSRWQRIAQAVEALGFASLHRSDHFTNSTPPDMDSLELWASLAWLASHTQRIEFGPLVTPVSFRHPVFTARIGKDVDDLSSGRLILGVGAGWQEREHHDFGFDLLDPNRRFRRFEEGLVVITRLLQSEDPVDYQGDFYQLHNAALLPRPRRSGGPPILVGGNGRQRTMPLAARFADEWNGVYVTAEEYADLNAHLDTLLRQHGRDPAEVRRSLMTGVRFGRDEAELQSLLQGRDVQAVRERGVVAGTPSEVVDQLGRLAEAGVQRVMLQWLELDDLDRLEAMAHSVLPQVQSG
jgi:F420-dependent oxidoreductase-like protein